MVVSIINWFNISNWCCRYVCYSLWNTYWKDLTMDIKTRLKLMKEYREEAMADPEANKFYIEDLDLSIAMFEKAAKNKGNIIQSGWLEE